MPGIDWPSRAGRVWSITGRSIDSPISIQIAMGQLFIGRSPKHQQLIASQAYACLNIRVIEIDAGRLWNVWRRTLSAEHTAAHSAARAKVGENAGIVQIPNPFGFLDPGRNIFRIMAMADNASSPESNSRGISLSPREGRYSGIKIYNRFCIVAIMVSLCFLGPGFNFLVQWLLSG